MTYINKEKRVVDKKTYNIDTQNGTKDQYLAELEEAKKHYESVIDTIQDGLCVVDSQYRIQSWNKAFAKRVGFGLKDLKNKRCRDVMPRYENGLFKNHCAHQCCGKECRTRTVFETGKMIAYLEHNTDKEGRPRYHRVTEFPTTNSSGKVEQVVIVIRDVSDLQIAQEGIRQLSQELEKKVFRRTWQLDALNKKLSNVLRLKSEFISDASHELRTPLTVIQGNLDIALSEAQRNSVSCPDVLVLIDKEVKHIANILSDLTMLTNSDTGFEVIQYERINLDELLTDVQQSLSILAEKKNIKITRHDGLAKKPYIMGDELKLERLFLNILRNAIKYTQEKGEIEIWAERERQFVSVHIKDNGIGIPEEDLANIFERFYRVDKARSRAEGGTGLGLSICKSIAEAHEGTIEVRSELAKGTEFTINLPYDYKKNIK